MFTELFTCFYDQSYRLLSHHQVSLLYTFWFLRWINVLPEAIYCCFTRTTLFTTMFTVIIVVKSMCIPSFFLIGCCVSELHGHICPYRNVWPEAVYCCFTRTTLFTTMFTVIIVVKSMCIPSFFLIGCCVSELHGHICPYRNVWPEAVYCCFTRTTLFTKYLT